MSTVENLEERVSLLEAEVRHLRMELKREQGIVSGRTSPDFLEEFAGIFANDPTFPEAVRLGQEWRYADRPLDEEEPQDNEHSGPEKAAP